MAERCERGDRERTVCGDPHVHWGAVRDCVAWESSLVRINTDRYWLVAENTALTLGLGMTHEPARLR